ncbi:MAG: hypothetical protein ACRCVG_00310 [Methanobacteriaceae archaeon]
MSKEDIMVNKNIQIIGVDENILLDKFGDSFTLNSFKSPIVFDNFDLNIIDMANEVIWRNNEVYNETTYINHLNDLQHFKNLINESKKSSIILMYPQDYDYLFWETSNLIIISDNREYNRKIELKNILPSVISIFRDCFGLEYINIQFGRDQTDIRDKSFLSSFYFIPEKKHEKLTCSNTGKITTMKYDNIVLTTLNVPSSEELEGFLGNLGLIGEKIEVPDWFHHVEMFDDKQQKKDIEYNSKKIIEFQNKIIDVEKILYENNKYKSILYTQNNKLEIVVREILDKIFDTNLSDFKDENLSDFLIEFEDLIFIGEIKGLKKNLKTRNVSQLRTHKEEYINTIEETKINEGMNSEDLEKYIKELDNKIKPLMIVNKYLNIPPNDREEINSRQIKLAEMDGSLLIETITLLEIFEQFLKNDLTKEKIIDLLKNETGLLKTI